MATLSVRLHLLQAEKLGEARENCQTRFAEYALARNIEIAAIKTELRMEAEREQLRLRRERDRQARDAAKLREQINVIVAAYSERLDAQAEEKPEIVPWLDTPVPPSLSQD